MGSNVLGTIGAKNERIRLEQAVLSSDGQGGHTTSWALLAVVDADIAPVGNRDSLLATQITSVLSLAVTIWSLKPTRADGTKGISVKDRIRWGARILQAESVQNPDGRNIELRILCSEVQA